MSEGCCLPLCPLVRCAAEQATALARVPRWRLEAAEARLGVGRLKVAACNICLEDWKPGEHVRCAGSS